MRDIIRFVRNGQIIEAQLAGPDETLLDYLRLRERRVGTKEGCAEGDCGACTVALGRRGPDGKVSYRPVNACIHLLGMADGAEIVTVEDIAAGDGGLHPVQQAMVDLHGSQCGFCTPGFVMVLFSLYHNVQGQPERQTVLDWLAGNLCRCTGYRPIIEAGIEACSGTRDDRHAGAADETATLLSYIADNEDVFVGSDDSFFAAPGTVDRLAELYEQHPDATLIAGGTDVGLWITKQLRDLPKIIHIGRVSELNHVEDAGTELLFGANVTFAAAEPYLAAVDPDLGELLRRIGGKQVRACGTLCGNIANGSPIGDSPPAFIALGATIELRHGYRVRALDLEDFYIDDGKQDRQPGEFVTGVMVPKPRPGDIFRCFKVSKRFDQDIAAVMGAFLFSLDQDRQIVAARIAYGGMAATPKRAHGAEDALVGADIRDARAWHRAFVALREDFKPIDDMRASARYRADVAHALLGKALTEAAGTGTDRTRLVGRREGKLDAAE